MGVGFEVYRSDGSLQIDDDSFTHYFVTKQTTSTVAVVDVGNPPSGSSMMRISFSTSTVRPIVAINSTATFGLYGRKQNGSNWEYRYLCNNGTGTTFTYYLFESMEALTPQSSGYGIEVYDSSGKVTFTTSRNPIRIVGVLTTTTDVYSDPGKTLAVALSNWAGDREVNETYWEFNGVKTVPENEPPMADNWVQYGEYNAYLYGAYVSGSTVYADNATWEYLRKIALQDGYGTVLNTPPNIFSKTYRPHLIVDVTNY